MSNQESMGGFTRNPAEFQIRSLAMETPWEYIYQNRDILLRVDQFGPVSAQAYPPGDIQLFRREGKFARWLVWLRSEQIMGGTPFTSFFRPTLTREPDWEPQELSVTYRPHEAVYAGTNEGLALSTTFFVPNEGPRIVMEFKVRNTRQEPVNLELTPALAPYMNQAQLAPWDKPEWYVRTGFSMGREGQGLFWSRLSSPTSQPERRRGAGLWTSRRGLGSFEVSMEKFCGAGTFDHPQGVLERRLRVPASGAAAYGTENPEAQVYGYPQICAARYNVRLQPGKSFSIRQVLFLVPPDREGRIPTREEMEAGGSLMAPRLLREEKHRRRSFFRELFNRRRVETADPEINRYVNEWLPLQLYWVASLDRGWPTGMRGTRDCANDFMGELYLEPDWAAGVLSLVLECQRADGWFPRQVSVQGRKGSHDLRPYVDGGAFVLEFLHEYIAFTGDTAFLQKPLPWLDREEEDTVLTHALRALEYYVQPENLGVHGLCKLRGGDWLDAVNRAGLEGRGESVMVTEQAVMAISYVKALCSLCPEAKFDDALWEERRQSLLLALRTHARNPRGFYNGFYTDQGQWICSDRDPDGETRPYMCTNAYAIASGAARGEDIAPVLRAVERLRTPAGYCLYLPPMGEKQPLEKVGRSGSGDGPAGLFENGTPYNHGSHGFLGRGLWAAGCPEKLLEVFRYMLPFDLEKHPTEEALTPPYAVVNCWNNTPAFPNRGGMLFLTGTIAMAMRMFYNWILGIQPQVDGLVLDPCCAPELGLVRAAFTVRGRKIRLILDAGARETTLRVNGKPWEGRRTDPITGREQLLIPYSLLEQEENTLLLH